MRTRAVFALGLVLLGCWLLPSTYRLPAQAQEGTVPKELTPRLITLEEKDVPLSVALAELTKQTGNPVEDRRKDKDDPRLRLALKKATFWEALDAIAKEADARVSLYERDGILSLVDGPYQVLPVSYNGLFRVGVKRMDLIRIFDPEAHYCNMHLEVAWEPRFQPFLLETVPDALVVQDDKGNTLEAKEGEKGQSSVSKRNAMEIEMKVPAPKRVAGQYSLLKGTLAVIGPTKMLTFTFNKSKLKKIESKIDVLKETQEGVTVTLRKFLMEGEGEDALWTAEMILDYQTDGARFESFQSWLVNNEIHMEKPAGKSAMRFPSNGGYETDELGEGRALIRYRFTEDPDKKLTLGKPEDWTLVYRTPGKIIEVPIPFEFKDLQLP